MKLGLLLAGLAVLFAPRAAAADDLEVSAPSRLQRTRRPVVVEYVAPRECASADAFHALLATEVARSPNPDRPWRFSIQIRHEGDYVGTLRTETATRELRAPTCDEVTAALALVIATAQAELPSPVATVAAPPPPPPPAPPPPSAVPRIAAPIEHDRTSNATKPTTEWRFGLRGEGWSDGSQLNPAGGMVTASIEVPWGFPKMMFELGAGALFRGVTSHAGFFASSTAAAPWLLLDAQACPIDLPIASTGLSVLGCGSIVVGSAEGAAAGWGGGGGRLRWQSPWTFYLEAHFNGLYGTRIEGIPALMDFGGSVGFRL